MNPNDPNVQMLDLVAERLGDELCRRLVDEQPSDSATHEARTTTRRKRS